MGAIDERRLVAGSRGADLLAQPTQLIFVRVPSGREVAPRAPARPGRGRRRSPLIRSTTKRSKKKMIKLFVAALVALAVYVALGVVLPASGAVALVVTVLGSWGAFTYKGLLALAAMFSLAARL